MLKDILSYGIGTLSAFAVIGLLAFLKGAKPADLPVERPTKFELVINVKAAKAIGLSIPQALLLQADQVVQ